MLDKIKPRSKSEEEILGYKEVLELILSSYDAISFTMNVLFQLHRDLYKYTNKNIGGKIQISQNYIVQNQNGIETMLFIPPSPHEAKPILEALYYEFNRVRQEEIIPILVLIPIFINDFLVIHPFLDGNGRISRLLIVLLSVQHNFKVISYISLEELILKQKALYL